MCVCMHMCVYIYMDMNMYTFIQESKKGNKFPEVVI